MVKILATVVSGMIEGMLVGIVLSLLGYGFNTPAFWIVTVLNSSLMGVLAYQINR